MGSTQLLQLPAEVLVAIMCYSADLKSLQNLILACHLTYSIYVENKVDVLGRILYHLVGIQYGCAVDAEHCAMADSQDIGTADDRDAILRDFMYGYKTKRAERIGTDQSFQDPLRTMFPLHTYSRHFETRKIESTQLDERWPARDVDHLCRLSRRHLYLERCVKMFLRRVLTLHRHRGDQTNEQQLMNLNDPPSAVEYQRLYRAFYRLEMWSLIFASDFGKRGDISHAQLNFRRWLWLSTFPAHELDEIGTVYQWLCDEWLDIVLHGDNVTCAEWGVWSFETQQWSLKSNFTLHGVQLLLDVLGNEASTRPQRVKDICAEPVLYEDLGSVLAVSSSVRDQYGTKTSHDGLPNTGDPLTFEEDDVDAPNAAWIWSKDGRMTTLFYDQQDTDLRRIGYVMWDQPRLACWPIYSKPRSLSRPRSEIRERYFGPEIARKQAQYESDEAAAHKSLQQLQAADFKFGNDIVSALTI